MSAERNWRLTERRAVNARTKVLLPHAVSRHVNVGEDNLVCPDGNRFGQGSLFPPSVHAGDVKKIEHYVSDQWRNWKRRKRSSIKDVKKGEGVLRIKISFDKFGVKTVGAFIRQDVVCTVFPEATTGTNYINQKGEKSKKSKK